MGAEYQFPFTLKDRDEDVMMPILDARSNKRDRYKMRSIAEIMSTNRCNGAHQRADNVGIGSTLDSSPAFASALYVIRISAIFCFTCKVFRINVD